MNNVRYERVNKDSEYLEYVVKLIFNEWVKGDESLFIIKKTKLENDSSVRGYVILDDKTPVGCFLICNDDIKGYPEYNPNLACVCIQKEHRGKGYSNYILKYSLAELRKMDIDKAYLKTNLVNFYEKVGWEPINEFCNDEMIFRINLKQTNG